MKVFNFVQSSAFPPTGSEIEIPHQLRKNKPHLNRRQVFTNTGTVPQTERVYCGKTVIGMLSWTRWMIAIGTRRGKPAIRDESLEFVEKARRVADGPVVH